MCKQCNLSIRNHTCRLGEIHGTWEFIPLCAQSAPHLYFLTRFLFMTFLPEGRDPLHLLVKTLQAPRTQEENPLGMNTAMLQPLNGWLRENRAPSYNSTLGKGWDCWELSATLPTLIPPVGMAWDGSFCALLHLGCAWRGTGCSEVLTLPLGAAGAQVMAFQVPVPGGSSDSLLLGKGGNGRL